MYLSQTPNGGTPYTRKDFSIDAKTADDLTTYVLSQFAQYAYPSITYDVTASSILLTSDYSLGIGDTIKVKDDNFSGGLLLQARVSEIVICSTNHANDLVVLSNYVKLKSQISDGSIEQMQALIKAATPYVASISTTNGVTFKNSTGSTVLTAHIYLGSSSNETIADDYEWFKDGVLLLSAQGLTVNASDVTDKAVYRFQATINGNIVATQEVTITNVSDGISPIDLRIDSSNGYQFKNNVINTTLTARLFQGNEEIDANGTDFSYVWTKTNSDGTDDAAWNLQHQAGSKTITITNSDLWQRATFDCVATSLN